MMTLSVVQNQMALHHDGGGGGSTDTTTRNMMDQRARARMPSGFAQEDEDDDDEDSHKDDDDDNGMAGQVGGFGATNNNNNNVTKQQSATSTTNTGDDNDSDKVNSNEMTNPGEHDVLLGRGGGTNNHVGNVNFRNLVNQHKMRYLASSKIEKPKVAREVVRIWKQLDPPGRFFQKKEGSGTDGALKDKAAVAAAIWIEVPDKKAREKASQCLRERTADVMPYLTQLQQQREQMREQGVSMISQHLAAAQSKAEGAAGGSSTGTGGGGSGSGSGRSSGNRSVIGSGGMNHMLSGGGGVGGGGFHPGMSHGGMGMMGGGGMMMGGMNRGGFMDPSTGHQMPVNRRVSMPAGQSPNTSVASMMRSTGTPSGTAADRRMSMPVGGRGGAGRGSEIGGNSSTAGPGGPETDVEQRVLQDAYSVMDRAGNPDPANVMYMEQLLEEERMMEREAMLAERHALMQERMMMQQERMMIQQQMQGGQMSPYGPGQPVGPMMNMMGHPGWSPMAGAGGGGGMPQNYNEMMFQQQQMMMAAHEQQRAVVDSHRQMMMHQASGNVKMTPGSVRSNDQVQPNLSVDGNENGSADGGALARLVNVDGRPAVVTIHDMEPIPYLEDGSHDGSEIPLSIIPDMAKSVTAAESAKKRSSTTSSRVKSAVAANDDTKPAALAPLPAKVPHLDGFGDGNDEIEVIPLKDPAPSSPRKLKSAFKRGNVSPRSKRAFKAPTSAVAAAAAAAGGGATVPHPPTDEAGLVEYRKTLENYMSAHKISAPTAVDNLIDDDLSDDEDIVGVDASAWLHETLNDSSDFSITNNKKKKRTKKEHHRHVGGQDQDVHRPVRREPERGVARNRSNESLMSTEIRSLDGKSMDGMSLMSLAISEMEEKERQQKEHQQRHPGGEDGGGDDSDMEEESVDFDGRGNKIRGARSTSSNHSVMSELTDFSDNGEDDDDDVDDVVL